MKYYWDLIYLTVTFLVCGLAKCEKLLHTITEEVGKGNFTHYHIKTKGSLRIELISHSGDADLYVSVETTRPDYEHYDMKSSTCGYDSVDIPSSFPRPIGVSVYGYPIYSQEDTTIRYSLSVYFVSDSDDIDYAQLDALYNKFTEEGAEVSSGEQHSPPLTAPEESEDEESTLWTIIITILKILFDVLL